MIGIGFYVGPNIMQSQSVGDSGRFKAFSDVEMAKYLNDNVAKFADRKLDIFELEPYGKGLYRETLAKAANSDGTGRFNTEDAEFARELLGRSELMDKLDRDFYSQRDNRLRVNTLRDIISKHSPDESFTSDISEPPSSWDDKTMMKYLINAYEIFADPYAKRSITMNSLNEIASAPANRKYADSDINVARELLKRGRLLQDLDRDEAWVLDGKIAKEDLLGRLAVRVEVTDKSQTTYGEGDEVLEQINFPVRLFSQKA